MMVSPGELLEILKGGDHMAKKEIAKKEEKKMPAGKKGKC